MLGAVSRSLTVDGILADQQVPEMFAEPDQEMLSVETLVDDLIDCQQRPGNIALKDLVR